jgi:hypothetical protein
MGVTTQRYIKKPLHVEAVRVTRKNFRDLAKWCDGKIQTEQADSAQNPGAKYIKVQAHNPINNRQTKAFVGDWILRTDRGFKVYTHQTFTQSFDEENQGKSYPYMNGGYVVIGPECFGQPDGSVICWKGVNYVPQNADRTVEAQIDAEREEMSS